MNRATAVLWLALTCGSVLAVPAAARTTPVPHEHAAAVESRGDRVMGFDHAKTTHHFLLTPEGGVIAVEANDSADVESRDRIRVHLVHIARMFSEGNFRAPMLIHDRVPPGVPAMQKLRSKIQYRFEPTERGGRIVISTESRKARRAVHEFLRFQIEDHRTGDPLEIGQQAPRR